MLHNTCHIAFPELLYDNIQVWLYNIQDGYITHPNLPDECSRGSESLWLGRSEWDPWPLSASVWPQTARGPGQATLALSSESTLAQVMDYSVVWRYVWCNLKHYALYIDPYHQQSGGCIICIIFRDLHNLHNFCIICIIFA